MRRREEECERLCDAKPVLVSERFEYWRHQIAAVLSFIRYLRHTDCHNLEQKKRRREREGNEKQMKKDVWKWFLFTAVSARRGPHSTLVELSLPHSKCVTSRRITSPYKMLEICVWYEAEIRTEGRGTGIGQGYYLRSMYQRQLEQWFHVIQKMIGDMEVNRIYLVSKKFNREKGEIFSIWEERCTASHVFICCAMPLVNKKDPSVFMKRFSSVKSRNPASSFLFRSAIKLKREESEHTRPFTVRTYVRTYALPLRTI